MRLNVLFIVGLLHCQSGNIVYAQTSDILGTWEATFQAEDYVNHHVLRFMDNNSYEYVILSDNPAKPFETLIGTFSETTDAIILTPSDSSISVDTLKIAGEALLIDRSPSHVIEFVRGREFSGDIHGTWELIGPDGTPTGGSFTVLPGGRFETDVSTGHEKGWYAIAGTAMVHFPTETSNPELLGIPGLWTQLDISDGILSYLLPGPGILISGRKIVTSLIQVITWSRVKLLRRSSN